MRWTKCSEPKCSLFTSSKEQKKIMKNVSTLIVNSVINFHVSDQYDKFDGWQKNQRTAEHGAEWRRHPDSGTSEDRCDTVLYKLVTQCWELCARENERKFQWCARFYANCWNKKSLGNYKFASFQSFILNLVHNNKKLILVIIHLNRLNEIWHLLSHVITINLNVDAHSSLVLSKCEL